MSEPHYSTRERRDGVADINPCRWFRTVFANAILLGRPRRDAQRLVIPAVLLVSSACDRAASPHPEPQTSSNVEWVNPAEVRQGPIKRERLSDDQVARITKVQAIFTEVDPTTLEQWLSDFKRDENPDREIEIYEAMAEAYTGYTSGHDLSVEGKKDVYQIVLLRSAAPADQVLPRLKLKVLTPDQATEIMRLYKAPARPIRTTKPHQ